MAVQIIDPNPDPSVVKRCICMSCGVKLAYTKPDIRRDYTSDYLGDKDYYSYITCPNCNSRLTVGEWW